MAALNVPPHPSQGDKGPAQSTYEWRPCTPPSTWADVVLFSNFSSPEYIMALRWKDTRHLPARAREGRALAHIQLEQLGQGTLVPQAVARMGSAVLSRARQRKVTPMFQAQPAEYATRERVPASLGLANLCHSARWSGGEKATARPDHAEHAAAWTQLAQRPQMAAPAPGQCTSEEKHSPDLGQALGTNVLTGMLNPSNQVWNELVNRAFVLHCARDPLGHFDFVCLTAWEHNQKKSVKHRSPKSLVCCPKPPSLT